MRFIRRLKLDETRIAARPKPLKDLARVVANGTDVAANVLGHDSALGPSALGFIILPRGNARDRYVGWDRYIK
jgi:hypothetical protein